MITAITPSTRGSRAVMDATLSTLFCATPVKRTGWPAGPGTACSARSWSLEASENSAALLWTVRNAAPLAMPVGAVGGPVRSPSTKVPAGDETAGDVSYPRQLLRHRRPSRGLPRRTSRDDDGDVTHRVHCEFVAKQITYLPGARRGRQHTVIGKTPFDAQERELRATSAPRSASRLPRWRDA